MKRLFIESAVTRLSLESVTNNYMPKWEKSAGIVAKHFVYIFNSKIL